MTQSSKGSPWLWILAGLLGLALIVVLLDQFFPVDIRPDGIGELTQVAEADARARLDAVRRSHGADAWDQKQVMDVVFYDDWPFWLTRAPLTPWDSPRQKLRGKLLRRSWTTEFELLDGSASPERWGVQSWKTWKAAPGQEPVFEDSWTVATTLAGLRYFLELPLPQDTATFVQSAGQATWEGKTYDRLYVTWEHPEAQREFDQYILWIDPESGLVSRVDFTIRALSGLAVARARFESYGDFEGVKLPLRIVIDGVLPTGHTLPVHTMEVESVRWDTFAPEALKPDATLVDMGEAKPN